MSASPSREAAAGPLTSVLAAIDAGSHSLGEVATRCDLPLDTVRACVDHLVRMGRLDAEELAIGCPTSGCGSCASGTDAGTAGCGARAPSSRRSGPVLVAISVRRH